MTDFFVFGGTSEGREIAQLLRRRGRSALIFVATSYGEALMEEGEGIRLHRGRLDEEQIREQIREHRPLLVVDATHPYAQKVSLSVRSACAQESAAYLRIERESELRGGCRYFSDMQALCAWLSREPGVIFSSLGTKEVQALRAVEGFQSRIRLRILPFEEGLRACLEAGFPARHLYCMQGPFSQELNRAMFRECGARILITKDSGSAGGFPEKVAAAQELGMEVAVLRRPEKERGITLSEFAKRLEEKAW